MIAHPARSRRSYRRPPRPRWVPSIGYTVVGTSQTYVPSTADIGHLVYCHVTASNPYGDARTPSNLLGVIVGVAPANTIAPVVSGPSVTPGYDLACDTGTWLYTPSGYTYQWQRDNSGGGTFSNIGSATAATYTLTLTDLHCYVRCVVTATNVTGSTDANSQQVGLVQTLSLLSGTSLVGALELLNAASRTRKRRGFRPTQIPTPPPPL